MKIRKYILSFLVCMSMVFMLFTLNINILFAVEASYNISVNTKSVSSNGKVRLSITGVGCEGSFSVSVSNGAVITGEKTIWSGESTDIVAGTQDFTITVTPISISNSSTAEKITYLKPKYQSISVKSTNNNNNSNSNNNTGGSTNSGTTTTEKPKEEEKSKENNLESLSVSAGTLSPEFAAGTTTYKVELTSDVEKITVEAKAKDSKATVSGTGEHELKIGENNISVTVKAENGSKKTYTVSVYVTEKPQQFVNVNDQEYGILNDLSKTDLPKGFEKATITIDEKEVTALKNEKLGITLLYLQSSADQKTGFYIYENDTVIGEYKTITVNDKIYVLLQAPKDLAGVENLKTGTVTIGDVEVNCWNFDEKEKENYAIVYLLNEEGEKSLYTYENTEGTLQKYIPVKQKSSMDTLTYVFIGTTAVFVVSTATLAYLYINFKKKSISAIKDYYNLKSQDD